MEGAGDLRRFDVESTCGWGRALRLALSRWYLDRPAACRWGETNTCLVRHVGPESTHFLAWQGLVGLAKRSGAPRSMSGCRGVGGSLAGEGRGEIDGACRMVGAALWQGGQRAAAGSRTSGLDLQTVL